MLYPKIEQDLTLSVGENAGTQGCPPGGKESFFKCFELPHQTRETLQNKGSRRHRVRWGGRSR